MRLKQSIVLSLLLLSIPLLFPNAVFGITLNEPIIADHTSVSQFEQIPEYWINQAKQMFKIGYGHTSHGSQITTGINQVSTKYGSVYNIQRPAGTYPTQPSLCAYTGGTQLLCYYEGTGYNAGWLELDAGYWPTWRDQVFEFYGNTPVLTPPYNPLQPSLNTQFNTIMWAWCGQVSNKTYLPPNGGTIYTEYLNQMTAFEQMYPNTYFIYMTGHLDGSGPTGNLYTNNNQIRDFVRKNNKILFDFADIESYAPDGTYYPNGSADCNWCFSWCTAHPSDCTNLGNFCAHSHPFNCFRKGKAFWWLLARMSGWNPTGNSVTPTPTLTPTSTVTITPTITPTSIPTPGLIPGDIDGNSMVNIVDFQLMINNWGQNEDIADIHKDNKVNMMDVSVVVRNFGRTN